MNHEYSKNELDLINLYMEEDKVFSSPIAWNSLSVYTVYEIQDHLLTTYLRRSKINGLKKIADLYYKELSRFQVKVKEQGLWPHDTILLVNMGGKLPYQLEDMHHDYIMTLEDIGKLIKGGQVNE